MSHFLQGRYIIMNFLELELDYEKLLGTTDVLPLQLNPVDELGVNYTGRFPRIHYT